MDHCGGRRDGHVQPAWARHRFPLDPPVEVLRGEQNQQCCHGVVHGPHGSGFAPVLFPQPRVGKAEVGVKLDARQQT
eukprot:scaffold38277_cov36-Prasinocladus_malaysianus.AAC.1